MIYDQQRRRRLRLLIKNLNKQRKVQGRKIDILCNDFIAAQREFIRRLNTVSFKASFYESIIGATDLSSLLYSVVRFVKEEVADSNVTFFLRQADNFELHIFENARSAASEKQHIENAFTPELMDNICRSNKVCTLDDMFAMGLQGKLTELNKLSALTVPLGRLGSSPGFILIYRSSDNSITSDHLKNICAVTPGLSHAIESCQQLLHPAD
jgi:hypothetical protein